MDFASIVTPNHLHLCGELFRGGLVPPPGEISQRIWRRKHPDIHDSTGWSASLNEMRWKRNRGAWIDKELMIGNAEIFGRGGPLRHRANFSLAIENGYRSQGLGGNFLEAIIDMLF